MSRIDTLSGIDTPGHPKPTRRPGPSCPGTSQTDSTTRSVMSLDIRNRLTETVRHVLGHPKPTRRPGPSCPGTSQTDSTPRYAHPGPTRSRTSSHHLGSGTGVVGVTTGGGGEACQPLLVLRCASRASSSLKRSSTRKARSRTSGAARTPAARPGGDGRHREMDVQARSAQRQASQGVLRAHRDIQLEVVFTSRTGRREGPSRPRAIASVERGWMRRQPQGVCYYGTLG